MRSVCVEIKVHEPKRDSQNLGEVASKEELEAGLVCREGMPQRRHRLHLVWWAWKRRVQDVLCLYLKHSQPGSFGHLLVEKVTPTVAQYQAYKAYNKELVYPESHPRVPRLSVAPEFQERGRKSDSMFINRKGVHTAFVHTEYLLGAIHASVLKETHQAQGPLNSM